MRKWNKLLSLLLAMVMALGMTVSALADEETSGDTAGDPTTAVDYSGWDTIKVFETTDVHGHITDVSTYKEETFQYRLAYLAKIVADARANEDYQDVLLLDGGDIYQGIPHSNLTYGAALRAAYDAMGYDAVALGNHEFDWDVTKYAADKDGTMPAYEIGEYKGDSDIPVLMYNLYDAKTGERVDFTQDYVVLDKGGYKVAVVGYADDYSPDIMAAKIAPYTIDDDLEKLAAKTVEVREETEADVLVVLAHADPAHIAEAMDPEVVDLVAGGHTHQNLSGVAENGVPYIQSRDKARNYATAEIKINPETKEVAIANNAVETIYDSENVEALYYNDGENEALDADIAAISQAAWDAVKEGMSEVLATVTADITKDPINENTTTSVAGNWITGLMLDATADLDTIAAFTNSGGIRTSLVMDEGAESRDITVADVYTISPFSNHFYTYTITGAQLAAHLENALQGSYENSNFGDQFSGIVAEYYDVMENGEKTGIKVTKITTDDGEEIDITDTKTTYNVVVNEYNATLDGSVFKDMEMLQELDACPIDNLSMIACLQARREADGVDWDLDTTVRAVKVEAPAEEPEEPAEPAALFSDVTEANWHYEFVKAMVDAGIVGGYPDGSFKPGDSVTWGAALKMVLAYTNHEDAAPVEGGSWASGYIALAKSEGLVDAEAEIDHNAAITRVEMCQLLAKALKIEASEKESTFPDTTDGYVVALAELGVIGGNPDGTFAPDGELTRAALCKILSTAPEAPAATEPAEGEDDAAPAEGEDDAAPAEGDEAAEPAEGEGDAPASDSDAPAEGESETPAEGETPAESTEPAEKAA